MWWRRARSGPSPTSSACPTRRAPDFRGSSAACGPTWGRGARAGGGGATAEGGGASPSQERRVVRDMSTDLMAIMNTVGFLIGLAVMGLTVYTATLLRRGEDGGMKG